MSTTVLAVPVEKSVRDRLAKIAAETGRTEEDLAAEAIAVAIEANDWYAAAIEQGLAEIERGEVISGEAVEEWLASWGTPNELPPPKVGQ
jgi:predicted transcriptional regulator